MQFHKGQTVVHPFHGPVRVTDLVTRHVRQEERRYVELTTSTPTMKIMVPIDSHQIVGIREIASPARVTEFLDLLGLPQQMRRQSWARKIKEFQARTTTGRLEDLCFVIREIRRAGEPASASTEAAILRQTRRRLAEELSVSLDISITDAEQVIDDRVSDTAPV